MANPTTPGPASVEYPKNESTKSESYWKTVVCFQSFLQSWLCLIDFLLQESNIRERAPGSSLGCVEIQQFMGRWRLKRIYVVRIGLPQQGLVSINPGFWIPIFDVAVSLWSKFIVDLGAGQSSLNVVYRKSLRIKTCKSFLSSLLLPLYNSSFLKNSLEKSLWLGVVDYPVFANCAVHYLAALNYVNIVSKLLSSNLYSYALYYNVPRAWYTKCTTRDHNRSYTVESTIIGPVLQWNEWNVTLHIKFGICIRL